MTIAERYRQHNEGLERFLVSFTGSDVETARDIASEVWLRVLLTSSPYDESRGVGYMTWLYHIAKNTARSYFRVRRREIRLEIDFAADRVNHAARLDAERVMSRLDHAVTYEQAQVLRLYEKGGLSYEEIAAVMEMPLGTVKCQMHRARMKMRRALS